MKMQFRDLEYKNRTSPSKTIWSNCGTSVMVDVKAGANCQCTFMKCKETENKDISTWAFVNFELEDYLYLENTVAKMVFC